MTDALAFETPPMSVSMPASVEWHMILDHELTQLSRGETGFLAAVGFVGLGAVLGLIPSLALIVDKVIAGQSDALKMSDMIVGCAFVGCLVLTIVCLIISGVAWRRSGCGAP
jgi:hypothetical protein